MSTVDVLHVIPLTNTTWQTVGIEQSVDSTDLCLQGQCIVESFQQDAFENWITAQVSFYTHPRWGNVILLADLPSNFEY